MGKKADGGVGQMIVVDGKEFRTLDQPIYLGGGERVLEAWVNGVKVYPEARIAGIKVVRQPDRIYYRVGEQVDYTGIVVKILDERGGFYTDSRYPDGTIPFSELSFPMKTASYDPTMATSDLDTGAWTQPIPTYRAAMVGVEWNRWREVQTFYAPDGVIVIYRNDAGLYDFLYASYAEGSSLRVFSAGTNLVTGEMTESERSYIEADRPVTHDGRTAWYGKGDGWILAGSWAENYPKPEMPHSNGSLREQANVAWTALYGRPDGEGEGAVVQWACPYDSAMYSAAVGVRINEV